MKAIHHGSAAMGAGTADGHGEHGLNNQATKKPRTDEGGNSTEANEENEAGRACAQYENGPRVLPDWQQAWGAEVGNSGHELGGGFAHQVGFLSMQVVDFSLSEP
jgi:hypothetical protein